MTGCDPLLVQAVVTASENFLPPSFSFSSSSSISIGTSTMDSSGLLRGLLFLGLLSVLCHGQASQEVSAEDFTVDKPEPAADRDLVSI